MIYKKSLTFGLLLSVLIFTSPVLVAQTKKELIENAKIDTLLSKFPARNASDLDLNMQAVLKLGEPGLVKLIAKLQSPGQGNNAPIEYAISGFSTYVSQKGKELSRKMSVRAYTKALMKLTDQQNKAFLISQFELVGKDDAVAVLSAYLNDEFLADPAVRSLVKINTLAAKTALLKALPTSAGNARLAIVKALGDLKYKPAAPAIQALLDTDDVNQRKMAFYALSYIADPLSEPLFSAAADRVAYRYDNSNVVGSYLIYTDQLLKAGNYKLAGEIGRKIMSKTASEDLAATRTNALRILIDLNPSNAESYLTSAVDFKDPVYFSSAVKFAAPHLTATSRVIWAAKLKMSQLQNGNYEPEQKLLLLRALFDNSKNTDIQLQILRLSEEIKVFNTIAFAAKYLEDPSLQQQAANTVVSVALAGEYSGALVTGWLTKALQVGNSNQMASFKPKVEAYIKAMKPDAGYVSIFNGSDLTGWKGLVADPIKRAAMDAKTLAAEQTKADAEMRDSWSVKNGELLFMSHGNNLATVKKYGDFEMLVDWKIIDDKKGEGDAGIYLRGTPQVQIWDNARTNVGAQVGSGGLYNNQVQPGRPLQVADNPLDQWNTFRIIMKGDRVTVYLNGVLVTDNVILENYWDRNQSIFPSEQIELQAHGSPVAYRDIYVRELPAVKVFELSSKEKREGYKLLFDGSNMFSWTGNTAEYVTENGNLSVSPKPGKGSGGNLYTKEEFSDFIFRFEFQLTPGANNGLGIRTPLEGDAAYVGMELQILDNEDPMYKDLHVYQYHGSVYGTIPAKRGFLKPVGEWNYQEVQVRGPKIKVILNGKVILDGDITEARKNGAPDKQQHPGLLREKGHIGFLGHGSPLKFRNIRIKDLSKSTK